MAGRGRLRQASASELFRSDGKDHPMVSEPFKIPLLIAYELRISTTWLLGCLTHMSETYQPTSIMRWENTVCLNAQVMKNPDS